MIAPGVIRPTPLFVSSVNQRLPSGPCAMPQRPMLGVSPVLNSEIEGPLAVATVAPAPRNAATNSDNNAGLKTHTTLHRPHRPALDGTFVRQMAETE